MITTLAMLVGLSYAVEVNVSGKLDLENAKGLQRVRAVLAGSSDTVDVNMATGAYSIKTNGGVGIKYGNNSSIRAQAPALTWKEIGKTVTVSGQQNDYVADAFTADGRVLVQGAAFHNNVAVVGNTAKAAYVRLRQSTQIMNTNQIAHRAAADTSKFVGNIVFGVSTCTGNICRFDTLTETPITSWDTVLPTKYVVQRNVAVTVPRKFVVDTIKVGWYNVLTNPKNYYTITLGNYSKNKYSGFIYSVYDSSSYGKDAYLYDAVVILKRRDTVIAFSDTSAYVTARTGDIEFDSADLVSRIIKRPASDTAIIPWYAVAVNKSVVNVTLTKVLHRDSTVTFSTIKLDSALLKKDKNGSYHKDNDKSAALGYSSYEGDTLMNHWSHSLSDTVFSDEYIEVVTLDSFKVSYVPDTSMSYDSVFVTTLDSTRRLISVTAVAGVRTDLAYKVSGDANPNVFMYLGSTGYREMPPIFGIGGLPGVSAAKTADGIEMSLILRNVRYMYK